MSEHVSRVPFSLDPLIAEAKRRARQRRMLVVVALVLVVAGGGATLALRPFGLLRTSQSTPTRFVPGTLATGVGGPIPEFTGGAVSAMSAASRSDAWIVGSVAWHWDGRAWRTVPLPKGNDLWSVAAVAPDDAWTVGALGDGSLARSHALIEHWDGMRWSVVQLPRLPKSFLFGVSAAGPRSAWAVGATYRSNRAGKLILSRTRPLLLHWDGASWSKQPLPWGRHELTLDRVVATGPSSVWVVSTGSEDDAAGSPSLIEHWNGTRWQNVPLPFGRSDPLAGFGATGWNDAWAVGSYAQRGNTIAKYAHSLAAHWNGRSWRLTHIPIRGGDNNAVLTDVAAARPDDVWALGQSQHLHLLGNNGLSATGTATFLEHWNGQEWQLASGATPTVYDGRPAVTATRDGSAWAMGTCFSDNFIIRWADGTWVFAKHPRDRHWRRGTAPSRRQRPVPSCSSSSS